MKGRPEESARRICGELQKKTEGAKSQHAAALERTDKALKFLEQNQVLVDTTTSFDSMDSATDNQQMVAKDEETYSDKITRIMDEYNVDESTAVEVVNKLIQEEQAELTRRQFEIQKQLEIERAQPGNAESNDIQQEQQPEQ